MHFPKAELERFIADSGLVSAKDLISARKASGESGADLGKVLVSKGYMSAEDLRRVHSYILGIPFVDLKGKKLSFEALSLIPEPVSRAHSIVSFFREGGSVEVAMLDPESIVHAEFLNKKHGFKIIQKLTDAESIKSALVSYQKALQSEFGEAIGKEAGELKKELDERGRVSKGVHSPSISRLFENLLRHAISQRADEIHLDPQKDRLSVRYRIGGRLFEAMILPKEIVSLLSMKTAHAAGIKEGLSAKKEGFFSADHDGAKISFRAHILQAANGEKVFIRIFREPSRGYTLEGLGFSRESSEALQQGINSSSGLILIAGPAGSGKSTTLYTLIDIISDPQKSVSVVEESLDPALSTVVQVKASPQTGRRYKDGLRAILRENPDVVGVGKIGDAETALLSLSAASTKLVIAGIEAASPAEALVKLAEHQPGLELLSFNLKGVVFREGISASSPKKTGAREFFPMTTALKELLSKPFTKDSLAAHFERAFLPGEEAGKA